MGMEISYFMEIYSSVSVTDVADSRGGGVKHLLHFIVHFYQ